MLDYLQKIQIAQNTTVSEALVPVLVKDGVDELLVKSTRNMHYSLEGFRDSGS